VLTAADVPTMPRTTKLALAAALIIGLLGFSNAGVYALSANAVGTGTLVAWLSDVGLEAWIRGEIELAGTDVVGDETVSFSARGTFLGFGVRRFASFVSEGWIGYEASGDAADGQPIEIRGLLYARRESLVPLQSGAVLAGSHRGAIRFRDEEFPFCGAFSGTVEGGLEPAETWGTIQLGGTGTAHLGEGPSAPIPLDHPALPTEFIEYVARLDLGL